MRTDLQFKKITYIPLYAQSIISRAECAKKIGISSVSVWRLKNRYLKDGKKIFVHANTGKPSHNPEISDQDKKRIIDFYKNCWSGAPYQIFLEFVKKELKIEISYTSITKILNDAGIISPKAHKPKKEKKKHLPRKEREREGELVQMDGSKHDWFMNGTKTVIHGGIDDATHKPTAFYMCENECLLGYNEILRSSRKRFGGDPKSAYLDRSAIFCTTKKGRDKVSIQEQLAGISQSETQFQKTCKDLKINLIYALSPEAKGRIERLWQTLQGRLPYIFRYYKINTIEKANEFLKDYANELSELFSIEAASEEKAWHAEEVNEDFIFSVKSEHKVKADGTFVYHGEKFKCSLPHKTVMLCLNERFGLKIYYNEKWYPVELCEPLQDTILDSMPKVEKDLIRRYFLSDGHENFYKAG